jgi:mannitol 2-dehydrogenase
VRSSKGLQIFSQQSIGEPKDTMITQLNAANLLRLDPKIQIPKYDRLSVDQSLMHLGVGGFHRAHQALYTDDLLQQDGSSHWGYCGVGLLKHDARIRDVMRAQDCLYTLVERSLEGDKARIIGSIVNFLFAPDDPQKVIEQMASPQTRIVSLTITEGGYYINQATGELDEKNPDLQYDLAHPHEPRCSFGYLLEALDRRRQRGLAPFTIMSCDNIQSNGAVAKKMLTAFAELKDPTFRNWMKTAYSPTAWSIGSLRRRRTSIAPWSQSSSTSKTDGR